jgi:hypothetical protein
MWRGWRQSEMHTGVCGGNVKKPLVNLRRKWRYNIKMYFKKKRDESTLNASTRYVAQGRVRWWAGVYSVMKLYDCIRCKVCLIGCLIRFNKRNISGVLSNFLTECGHVEETEAWLHSFLTSTPDVAEWSTSCPGLFTLGKKPVGREVVWVLVSIWTIRRRVLCCRRE